jgi:hypothetical protein
MDALHLADHLYKKLRQRREDIQVSLGTGNIGSFDEYRLVLLMSTDTLLGRSKA